MRLIDVDARVTVQSFDPMNEEYYHNEMTVEQALDFATDEGCPPAVDAIPVEWLREKANGNDFVIGRAARFILRTWEQEAR